MRRLLVLIALLLMPLSAQAEHDKDMHFGGSYALTAVMLNAGFTRSEAFWTMMLIGAIKEATDNNTQREHMLDTGANALGSAAAVFTFRIEL